MKVIEQVALGRTESIFSAKEHGLRIEEFKQFFHPSPIVNSKVLTFFGNRNFF